MAMETSSSIENRLLNSHSLFLPLDVLFCFTNLVTDKNEKTKKGHLMLALTLTKWKWILAIHRP